MLECYTQHSYMGTAGMIDNGGGEKAHKKSLYVKKSSTVTKN